MKNGIKALRKARGLRQEDMAKLLRQHYAYKKDDIQYAKDLAKLRMWGCKI